MAVITGSLTSNTGGGYDSFGGGIMVDCSNQFNCSSSFANNDILNNSAAQTLTIAGSNADGQARGGGLSFFDSRINLRQNRILNNLACFSGPCQFALWNWQSVLTSTNNVFASNPSGGVGIDGSPTPSQAKIINDSFYNNSFVGIQVNDVGNTLYVTNTIISNHQIGLSRTDPAATLVSNFNLLNNTTNYAGGVSPGAQDIIGQDPLFVNAASNDFHLTTGTSPAIDKGTATGAPGVDFENNSRPQGLGIDIGADEFSGNVYLPIVLK
jgi:hypothetical protein